MQRGKHMQWLEISIETASAGIAQVAALLTANGFEDLVIEDQAEFEDFLEQNRDYWDYVDEALQEKLQGLSCIKLYLQEDDMQALENLKALLEKLQAQKNADFGSLALKVQAMPEQNWEESWKDNYPPQPVGERLMVIPYWLADMDLQGRLPVILDPGLTFGTGAHPSTQMVMQAMEQRIKAGDSCLDLGSGSGILSIAALRLGAKSAAGVDVDPKAEDIARSNAERNGFDAACFTALTGNVLQDKSLMQALQQTHYDVVLVNIVADVIIALAPVLPQFLSENSCLICSGILDTRLAEVTQAFKKAGLHITQTMQKEDWRCVCAKRSLR